MAIHLEGATEVHWVGVMLGLHCAHSVLGHQVLLVVVVRDQLVCCWQLVQMEACQVPREALLLVVCWRH